VSRRKNDEKDCSVSSLTSHNTVLAGCGVFPPASWSGVASAWRDNAASLKSTACRERAQ
jgi:hypothetical protein